MFNFSHIKQSNWQSAANVSLVSIGVGGYGQNITQAAENVAVVDQENEVE